MQTVGDKIKAAREESGMTQEQLGKLLGVTGVAVMRYEKGQRQPNINQRLILANIFQTPTLHFIDQDIYGYEKVETFPESDLYDPIKTRLNAAISQLNSIGQQIAVERVEELTKISDYQKAADE